MNSDYISDVITETFYYLPSLPVDFIASKTGEKIENDCL